MNNDGRIKVTIGIPNPILKHLRTSLLYSITWQKLRLDDLDYIVRKCEACLREDVYIRDDLIEKIELFLNEDVEWKKLTKSSKVVAWDQSEIWTRRMQKLRSFCIQYKAGLHEENYNSDQDFLICLRTLCDRRKDIINETIAHFNETIQKIDASIQMIEGKGVQ